MKVDLHIHTVASDGSWTPGQLVDNIRAAGIDLFAVTDHDTLDSVVETAYLAKKQGLIFVPGVEICATHQGKQYHILGYGIDCQSLSLRRILDYNNGLMEDTDKNSIRQLIRQGLNIEYDEYLAYEYERSRGGWKSLNYLIDKGLCQGVGDFFGRLFTPDLGLGFPDFLAPTAVIDGIHSAGGLAILAHPGSAFHGTILENTLEFFRQEDVDGVECFHPGHDQATTALALAWCRQRNLLVTGGSDCHGDFVPGRSLGQPLIDFAELNLGELVAGVDKNLFPRDSFRNKEKNIDKDC